MGVVNVTWSIFYMFGPLLEWAVLKVVWKSWGIPSHHWPLSLIPSIGLPPTPPELGEGLSYDVTPDWTCGGLLSICVESNYPSRHDLVGSQPRTWRIVIRALWRLRAIRPTFRVNTTAKRCLDVSKHVAFTGNDSLMTHANTATLVNDRTAEMDRGQHTVMQQQIRKTNSRIPCTGIMVPQSRPCALGLVQEMSSKDISLSK